MQGIAHIAEGMNILSRRKDVIYLVMGDNRWAEVGATPRCNFVDGSRTGGAGTSGLDTKHLKKKRRK